MDNSYNTTPVEQEKESKAVFINFYFNYNADIQQCLGFIFRINVNMRQIIKVWWGKVSCPSNTHTH